MLVTAFSGSTISLFVWNALTSGNFQVDIAELLLEIGSEIPIQISSVWINWMIVRSLITLPLVYLAQVSYDAVLHLVNLCTMLLIFCLLLLI